MIGRVVNHVSRAKMRVENESCTLSRNGEDGVDHFNGGFVGFDNVNWNSYVMKKHVVNTLVIVIPLLTFYSVSFPRNRL